MVRSKPAVTSGGWFSPSVSIVSMAVSLSLVPWAETAVTVSVYTSGKRSPFPCWWVMLAWFILYGQTSVTRPFWPQPKGKKDKASDPAPDTAVSVGQPLTYTLQISNTGVVTATTTITDTFSPLLTNPVCNGVPGNLNTVVSLFPGAMATFVCTASVEPTLSLDLTQQVDQETVMAGTAVTITVTLTNSTPVTLTQLQLDLSYSDYCPTKPADLLPLPAGGSISFICPNVPVAETTTYTATAATTLAVDNIAAASAPEASQQGTIYSALLTHPLPLLQDSDLTVIVIPDYKLYLPLIYRS
jgi:uncharacterized repeat protein (TIGR01451 family)